MAVGTPLDVVLVVAVAPCVVDDTDFELVGAAEDVALLKVVVALDTDVDTVVPTGAFGAAVVVTVIDVLFALAEGTFAEVDAGDDVVIEEDVERVEEDVVRVEVTVDDAAAEVVGTWATDVVVVVLIAGFGFSVVVFLPDVESFATVVDVAGLVLLRVDVVPVTAIVVFVVVTAPFVSVVLVLAALVLVTEVFGTLVDAAVVAGVEEVPIAAVVLAARDADVLAAEVVPAVDEAPTALVLAVVLAVVEVVAEVDKAA